MNQDEYRERIDTVTKYIVNHSRQKLTLDELADISGFSKYHFTRIFSAVTGMTPIAFVNRERLQRAVRLLAETNQTVLDIAAQCGFESVSTFNGLFKKHYSKTPSQVRNGVRKNRNFPILSSNKPEDCSLNVDYNQHRDNPLLRRAWESMVTIKELPAYEVAYVRHVGSYLDTRGAWDKLGKWASGQGFTPDRHYFIGISLDDGNLVEEFACRYDACVTVPKGFDRLGHEGMVEFKALSGGLYAVYPYYDTVANFVLAYQTVYSLWLPNSGYEADDRPCLEFCLNDPAQDPEGKCKVDLYIPVKKQE